MQTRANFQKLTSANEKVSSLSSPYMKILMNNLQIWGIFNLVGLNESKPEKNLNSGFELISGSVLNFISLDCLTGLSFQKFLFYFYFS